MIEKRNSRIKIKEFSKRDFSQLKQKLKNLKLHRNKKEEKENIKSTFKGLKKLSKSNFEYIRKKLSAIRAIKNSPQEIWENKKTKIFLTYNKKHEILAAGILGKDFNIKRLFQN